MPSFVIAHFEVQDSAGYLRYTRAAIPLIEAHAGRTLVADDDPMDLQNGTPGGRVIVIEFPSRDQARAWLDSPEYQAAARIREAATATHTVLLADLLDAVVPENDGGAPS